LTKLEREVSIFENPDLSFRGCFERSSSRQQKKPSIADTENFN